MKSIIAMILVVTLCFGMIACSAEKIPSRKQTEDETLKQIYEVNLDDDQYCSHSRFFNHRNVINDELVITQEYEKNTVTKFQNKNRNYDLQYIETCFFPMGDRKEHKYHINGDEESEVLLREDGTISFIHYPIAKLNIAQTASFEDVWVALGPALSDLIDLTQFTIYKDLSIDNSSKEGFCDYTFNFFRMINGYLTNSGVIYVTDDGTVDLLRNEHDYTAYEKVCYQIDQELEAELLRKKIENIYNTDASTLLSYEYLNSYYAKRLIIYNNELCVDYKFECKYFLVDDKEEDIGSCELLIPVKLLISSESKDAMQ